MCVFITLSGCASYSTRTAISLDKTSSKYATPECQENLPRADDQEHIKWARTAFGPLAILITGGIALAPVVVTNMSFDTKDEMVSNDIANYCGGDPKSTERVVLEVGGNAALNVVTAGTNLGPAVSPNHSSN